MSSKHDSHMLVKQVRMEISRCRQLDYHISSGRWKSGKSAGQIRENSQRASREGRKKGRVMAPEPATSEVGDRECRGSSSSDVTWWWCNDG